MKIVTLFLALLPLAAGVAQAQTILSPDPNRDRFLQPLPNPATLLNQPALETTVMSADKIREILRSIARQTGKNPALVTINFANNSDTSQLELVLVTPEGSTKRTLSGGTRKQVLDAANKFRSEITNPTKKSTTSYLPVGQQLYQWLVAPLEADMQEKRIDTLIVSLHPALRSLPLAALHDGNKFLIEKYSISLIPSFSKIGDRYVDIKTSQVLAMGASNFKEQNPLPTVPAELSSILKMWPGKSLLNEEFTVSNLTRHRIQPFNIIHIATHENFQLGKAKESYLQFWDTKLTLDNMRQLGWNKPPVELLVLSSGKSALGDDQAEFGFAGAALKGGAKSAIGSLWYVSDEGTAALMEEFYKHLKTAPIKAEALRGAQIAMLKRQLSMSPEKNLSHPYYWASFTLVGSAW